MASRTGAAVATGNKAAAAKPEAKEGVMSPYTVSPKFARKLDEYSDSEDEETLQNVVESLRADADERIAEQVWQRIQQEEAEERARQHQERNERLFRSQQSIEEEEERLKQTLHDSFVEMKVTEPEEPVLDEFAIKEAKS